MNSFVIICPRENKVFIAVHFSLKTMVDGLISLNQLISTFICLTVKTVCIDYSPYSHMHIPKFNKQMKKISPVAILYKGQGT